MKARTDRRFSDLWRYSEQGMHSAEANGVHANSRLWSFKKTGAMQIPRWAATLVSVVSWSRLLK